ncbi:MAG: hypothetical protein ACC726_15720 [Chloroflexota bacterium]
MTEHSKQRRQLRLMAAVLVALWAATAVAIAAAYRPGGPVDIVVVLACFLPVLVAAAALQWPPEAAGHRHRVALGWIWIAAVLFAIPVLYGVASTLAAGGPQNLVPSPEAAYAGILAMFSLSLFSVVGLVHSRRAVLVFDRAATWRTAGLAVLLTIAIAAAFGLVALINDLALRRDEPLPSRFGPTDPELLPPLCDEPLSLGENAVITIEARSSVDNVPRGSAIIQGQRSGIDEAWRGSWQGPDGTGQAAYLRVGRQAWLNRGSDDPEAPGSTWQQVAAGLFGMADPDELTMDGPALAIVSVPRGSIVPEDLGLEVVDGARARHCRTFIDGPTALTTFLPLRWLLDGDAVGGSTNLRDWRGEMDWWVFGDGELGRASVEISGRRAEAGWDSDGVRGVLEAELEAVDRTTPVDVTVAVAAREAAGTGQTATPSVAPQAPPATQSPNGGRDAALESGAP